MEGEATDAQASERLVAAEDRVLERFGLVVERRLVDVPAIGGQARVLVAGEGPPVVLVIGAGPPAALWAPLMAELREFTLHVVELPGMGPSDPAPYTSGTVRSIAVGFLAGVLDGLGLERPPVIAQSVGGLWAVWLALEQPERVAGLVLVAAPALLLGNAAPLQLRVLSLPIVGALLMRVQPPSPRQVDRLAAIAGESFADVPELRQLWLELERLPTYAPSLRRLIRASERLRGARPELALTTEQLGRLRRPVRLIWGADDPFGSPELGARAAELIPEATLHVVPGGHAPWLDSPEQMASLATPFLRGHGAHR